MKGMKAYFYNCIVCFDVDFTFIVSTSEMADKTTFLYWIVVKRFFFTPRRTDRYWNSIICWYPSSFYRIYLSPKSNILWHTQIKAYFSSCIFFWFLKVNKTTIEFPTDEHNITVPEALWIIIIARIFHSASSQHVHINFRKDLITRQILINIHRR